ncbi:MAG: DUF3160 domain-containing protein [Tissierellia bacterium]|nr:DUF3160 domain-containing protein [Tissierellia bacterium]
MKSKKKLLALSLALILLLSQIVACSQKPEEKGDISNKDEKIEVESNDKKDEEIAKDDNITKEDFGIIKLFKPQRVLAFEIPAYGAKPELQAYSTNKDLSNIANLNLFKEYFERIGNFSEKEMEMLSENNFFAREINDDLYFTEQMFNIYEINEYENLPSIITTDSIYHLYHIFYSATLRRLEEGELLDAVKEMNEKLLSKTLDYYEKLTDEKVKEEASKVVAFFAVADHLLNGKINQDVPKSILDIAQGEIKLIEDESGIYQSKIVSHNVDYTQFKPRGHYTRSNDLEKYFKTVMLYGHIPFRLFTVDGDRNESDAIKGMLISLAISTDEDALNAWQKVYDLTTAFVGQSDDLSFYDYVPILKTILSDDIDANRFSDSKFIDAFYEEVKSLPAPRLGKLTSDEDSENQKQLRVMGQRYILDSDVYKNTVIPLIRPLPTALDFMYAMGSDLSKEILMQDEYNNSIENFELNLEEARSFVKNLPEVYFKGNIYSGWLQALKPLLRTFPEGYPSFMTNRAYNHKSLATALGSYAELKHDTVLYGKQLYAEMGGWEALEVKNYVEPNVEAYSAIKALLEYSRENLNILGYGTESINDRIDRFIDLVDFCIECSIKELNNEMLSPEDEERIKYIGGEMEALSITFVMDDNHNWTLENETDRHMALVSDIATATDSGNVVVLCEAVGKPNEFFAVVPIGEELHLMRGASFDYYEFWSKDRLTDEQWLEKVKTKDTPEAPEWTNEYIAR